MHTRMVNPIPGAKRACRTMQYIIWLGVAILFSFSLAEIRPFQDLHAPLVWAWDEVALDYQEIR